MFTDTAKVSLKAGKGGDGAVSFRHEIYIPKGGPDGGDGGKGGSIIFRADEGTNTLIDFRFTPILTAEDGKNGSGQRSAGRSGKNLVLEVPIGTIVKKDGEIIADLIKDGQEAIIAKGGDGGFGNAHFKSSTRQTPIVAEVGEPGEEFEAELELKSMADVGLVGLPNAGKSTFLSVVSNAKPEIANYPFTTITPNLGVATIDKQDLLIADIPGLIEGASEGKGLGHDFLRHVDRTAVLLHLVDVYNDDAGEAYAIIRHELEKYSDLKDRPEVVALTKCEGLDQDIIELQKSAILEKNPKAKIFTISSQAHQGIQPLLRELKNRVEDRRQSMYSQSVCDQRGAQRATETRNDGLEGASQECIGVDCNNEDVVKMTTAQICHRSLDSDEVSNISGGQVRFRKNTTDDSVPTISLNPNALKDTWKVEKTAEGIFVVTGEKIEKFARRTDLNNYASVNRLRDILKKLGIRAELTSQGAKPDSIISIAGKEFTLVEDY